MFDFLLGSCLTMVVLKLTGAAAIGWATVYAPIYLPVLLILFVYLLAEGK